MFRGVETMGQGGHRPPPPNMLNGGGLVPVILSLDMHLLITVGNGKLTYMAHKET